MILQLVNVLAKMDKSKAAATSTREALKSILQQSQSGDNMVGWIINEQLVNMPPMIVVPVFDRLV
jgi:hypothetical protein